MQKSGWLLLVTLASPEVYAGEYIATTANGEPGLGSASLSACTFTGSGAARFSVLSNNLNFSSAGTQSLSIGCDYPSADALATLTCTEIDADSPAPGVQRAFHLRCPAAPPPPISLDLSYQPLSGTLITFAEGQVPNTPAPPRTIAIRAFGNTGTASVSACTLSGSGADRFSVSPTGLDFSSPGIWSGQMCQHASPITVHRGDDLLGHRMR